MSVISKAITADCSDCFIGVSTPLWGLEKMQSAVERCAASKEYDSENG